MHIQKFWYWGFFLMRLNNFIFSDWILVSWSSRVSLILSICSLIKLNYSSVR